MKYFAMIGGQQYGPMTLDEMVREGVRPDTYVWCKGMNDWTLAEDVPDICRYFRQRLSGTLPSQRQSGFSDPMQLKIADEEEQERLLNQLPLRMRPYVRRSGIKLTKESLPDPSKTKQFHWALPILLYIICLIVILIGFLLL